MPKYNPTLKDYRTALLQQKRKDYPISISKMDSDELRRTARIRGIVVRNTRKPKGRKKPKPKRKLLI